MSDNTDQLNDIFTKFLHGKKLFVDRQVLRPDFIPTNLPHRSTQLSRIAKIMGPVLTGTRGSNIFIYGKTGTGKTAVVKFVLNHLLEVSNQIGAPVKYCYVNCRLTGTIYRVIIKLGESVGLKIPFTGLATSEVFDRFENALELNQVLLIVVLDEIDALIKNHGDNLIYELTRVNETLKNAKVSIIGISNDLLFKDLLDPRVLSSLGEEEVVFRPYTALELKDILLDRAKIAFYENVVDSGVINLCSALAAAEHGDARRALDLLRVAGEIAERDNENKVSEVHVRYAQNKIEQDRVSFVLKTLPIHSKLVLCSIYLLHKIAVENVITGDVYDIYSKICNDLSMEPLTQRRVSGLINELDISGIVNARLVNFGRYGRTKKIRLGVSTSIIISAFSDDSSIKKILTYTPSILKKR